MDFSNNEKVQALVIKLYNRFANTDLAITMEEAQREIEFALLEYYNDRHFTPTDKIPFEDIYAGIIFQLAVSAINKFGAEGETYHSEGGLIRNYDSSSPYPLKLTQKIIPLAKGVELS